MSGTRSPSRKAPATDALIVAHGQPCAPQAGESAISRLVAAVQALMPETTVAGATLAAPGALEHAVAGARPDALVFPMFMAGGWFVNSELPRRLNAPEMRILAPLGLTPGLATLAVRRIRARLSARHWKPAQTQLLIAGHGSTRSRVPAEATQAFAQKVGDLLQGITIVTGFIEEAPRLQDAARSMAVSSFCLPFFAAEGGHVRDDIPTALTAAGFCGELLQPIGLHQDVPALIAAELSRFRSKEVAA